jgi:hypothetical protein
MWIWENRWGGEFGLPPQLVHAACGKALNPVLACSHCDARVVAHDVPVGGQTHQGHQRERNTE